ncbi:immunoglobulin domain-containing protein [Sinomicrobium sp. M5D2P17]
MYPGLEQKTVILLLYTVLSFSFGCLTVNAQQPKERVYAASQTNGAFLGSVSNPANVIGNGLNTSAGLNVPVGALGLSNAHIQPRFGTVLTAGTSTYLKLGVNPSLLGVGITINVRAYNGNTAVGTQVTLGSLLSLLNGEYLEEIVFTPTDGNGDFVAYDGVRVTLNGGVLSAGANIDVYYAYYLQNTTSSIACDTPVEVLYGSTGALLSGVNQVENPQYSIDSNTSTYTHLRSNVGVLDKTYIRSLYNTLSREGDSIRVIFQNPGGGLLEASLLATSLTITTYNDDTDNGALTLDESLLSLSLLPGSSDVQVLTYPVEATFNRIEVSLGEGLLNALSSLHVYEIQRIAKGPGITSPQMTDDVVYSCFGDEVTLEIDQPVTGSVYTWYTAPTGGTLVFTGTSYTPDTTITGSSFFYASETRAGCTNESGRSPVELIVFPAYGNPDIVIGNTTN